MARVTSFLAALPIVLAASAVQAASGGAPVQLAHSGFVLDAEDRPIDAASVPFTFAIFGADAGGEPEWAGACTLAVASGYYAATLGAAPCAGSSTLDTADLPAGQARWLEVVIDGTAMTPRLALGAVPTSALAADADRLGGIAAADYLLKAELAPGGTGEVDAARLTSGTLPGARLGGTYANAVELSNAANVLAGDGAGLTSLDASQLSSGTLPGARLGGTYANALDLTNAGNTLAGDGSAITGLDAAALATGTIPSARLAGTYANSLTFSGAVSVPNGLAIPNGTSLPGTAGAAGSVFFKTDDGVLYASNGTSWVPLNSAGGASAWPLGSSGNPAASCSAIKTALPTAASSTYYVTTSLGAVPVWCDMDTDGGGWTLVLAATDTARWKASNTAWNDTSYDAGLTITPFTQGKSLAYSQVTGDQILFKTHAEAAGRWAVFDLPAASTLLGLVGTTNVMSLTAGTYQKTLTGRALGSAAHPCWGGDWRVNFRGYYSSDSSPDTSVFAPAGVAVGRPCQGSTAHASGAGVATDSNNASWGGSFEGAGVETGGSAAVFGGYMAIYIRTKPAAATPALGTAANPATSCKAIQEAGAAGASGLYYLTGNTIGRFRAYCDFGTDIDANGGWTLVMSTGTATDAKAWRGFASVWWNTLTDFPGAGAYVTPTALGKSPAYYQVAGTEFVIRTHSEASGRWARYSLPSSTTLAALLGTTNLQSQTDGYKATLTKVAVGSSAVACFNQNWRVNWRRYASSDSSPDSSVFAPSTLTSSVRPCGGNTAYATGIGVETDTSGGYGGFAEGYGSDGAGSTAVTGGHVSLYVR